jgi:selenocysteine lyase/cysteine desulfurase
MVYQVEDLPTAAAEFARRHPDFDAGGPVAELRRAQYGRLDDDQHIYLDYTGGGLHAVRQVDEHAELLKKRVLGNPHSNNPSSLATTELVAHARGAVHDFLGAPPEDYLCIFTANASAALRLVGEAYPFAPGGAFALTSDNHNSVNGIREFARRAGARFDYIPVVAPELRLDRGAATRTLHAADRNAANLFAFPAQSNFSGVQHPLDLIEEAHDAGWDVLVDAAAYAPTNALDIGRLRPDFVAMSMYKIFGYPTGVGVLLMRKDRVPQMRRPWFAGGTITIASVQGDGHFLHSDEAGFEDGTIDYLNLPAVTVGLRHITDVGIDTIHRRVMILTEWLLGALTSLRHGNGRPLVTILGPTDTTDRGGTVTFVMQDCDGRPVDDRRIEELANGENISLRTGCFCNPGAGEIAHGLSAEHMTKWFREGRAVSFLELRERLLSEHGRLVAAVRVSTGIASDFSDVFRFLCFMQGFVDRSVDEIGLPAFVSAHCRIVRDSA